MKECNSHVCDSTIEVDDVAIQWDNVHGEAITTMEQVDKSDLVVFCSIKCSTDAKEFI